MTSDDATKILLARCGACGASFVPRPGRCPRCHDPRVVPYPVRGTGVVRAACDVMVPPEGFDAPHRLALVALDDGPMVLTVGRDIPLTEGARVRVRRDGGTYRAEAE